MTPIFTQLSSLGTIALQILIGVTVLAYGTQKYITPSRQWIRILRQWLQVYGLHVGFVLSSIAMLGSLYFSDIAKYTPCVLCWYQRIFMYAQVFLFGLALFRKEWVIRPYALFLSLAGAGIALFHYTEQISSAPISPCTVVGYGASCSEYYTMNYGYITIPIMAGTIFLAIAGSMWLAKDTTKQKGE